jgi:hypothetical protein
MSEEIPVVWHSQEDGRGHYNCTAMLNEAFDVQQCVHYPGWKRFPHVDGAVVVVHGGREHGRLDRLNEDISELLWVLLIFLGDEEASFPAERVHHPNKLCWVQEPLPGKHDFADRFMLDGYTPLTHLLVKTALSREYDWFFAGQVTHERRRACVDALRTLDWGGVIIETKGYCQGVSPSEYYSLMARSKIVPCPSGPHSPDSARVCEALECGCIPILDDLSPTRPLTGFWNYVLGYNHPLPVITEWDDLPDMINDLRRDYTRRSIEIQNWWINYRYQFINNWLVNDLKVLRGEKNV